MTFDQLSNWLQFSRTHLRPVAMWAQRIALILAISYVAASTLSAWLASTLLDSAISVFNKPMNKSSVSAALNFSQSFNYYPLVKAIKDRNLFNSDGKFPEESSGDGKQAEEAKPSFDINAPCSKPTINADLVGTIFSDGSDSLAIIQEQGYSDADVYHTGDLIIGSEDAAIVRIERNRVILNNKSKKECLELASATKGLKDVGFPATPPQQPGNSEPPRGDGASSTNECVFDEKYVQSELGSGFGTIIQKARLVPNTTDNVMNGFKIFAIDMSSLLGKTGLQNGDIITQVNETSLKQPEQGFALYQALQDEKEVRIHILRQGTTPMTLVCRIK